MFCSPLYSYPLYPDLFLAQSCSLSYRQQSKVPCPLFYTLLSVSFIYSLPIPHLSYVFFLFTSYYFLFWFYYSLPSILWPLSFNFFNFSHSDLPISSFSFPLFYSLLNSVLQKFFSNSPSYFVNLFYPGLRLVVIKKPLLIKIKNGKLTLVFNGF